MTKESAALNIRQCLILTLNFSPKFRLPDDVDLLALFIRSNKVIRIFDKGGKARQKSERRTTDSATCSSCDAGGRPVWRVRLGILRLRVAYLERGLVACAAQSAYRRADCERRARKAHNNSADFLP